MKTYTCKVCNTEWTVEDGEIVNFCPVCYTRVGVEESISEACKKSIFRQVQGLMEHDKYKEAIAQLKRAITRNDEYAQYMLGECYNSGWGVVEDKDKAFELFLLSAEQGYVKAQLEVAHIYLDSTDNDVEILEKAEYWLEKAYEQGFNCEKELAKLKKSLAYLYEFGDTVDINEEKAFQLFQDAANLNIDELGMEVPLCYFYGIGVEKDYKTAAIIFDNLQEQGLLSAQKYLAICYQNGLGVEVNYNKAFDLYKYVYEKELVLKYPEFKLDKESLKEYDEEIFNIIKEQLSYEKNFVPWLEKGAERGDKYAQCELGWYYLHKVLWYKGHIKYSSIKARKEYTEKLEFTKAEEYMKMAYMLFEASAKEEYRKAKYLVGYLLEHGYGCKKSLRKAKQYYKEAIIPEDTFAVNILSKPKFWFC